MGSIISRIRDFDDFAEPISVNYKGDSAFKTLPGAFLSLVLKGLVFMFTMLSLLELFAYKNPAVSAVSQISQISSGM